MALYQDGEFLGSTDISHIENIDAGLPLAIGQDGALSYPFWFNGLMGELRIWRKVLAPETIRRYACSVVDSAHPDYESLLAYWPLDEGGGSVMEDAGPAGVSCNMQGAPANWVNSPGEMRCLNYDDTPRITDIATTALQHLCVPIDPDWNLDGTALTDLCMLTGTGEQATALRLRLGPNPFRDMLAIDFGPGADGKEKKIVVFDTWGRKRIDVNTAEAHVEFDTRAWPAGCYWVQIRNAGEPANCLLVKP